MDKPSAEKQVCGDMAIKFVVRAILLVLVGLMAG